MLFNFTGNNCNFKDISFDTNNINFLSERLNVKKDKKEYFFKGNIRNKNSIINDDLLQIIKLKYHQYYLTKTNFKSDNDYSFNVDNKCKV